MLTSAIPPVPLKVAVPLVGVGADVSVDRKTSDRSPTSCSRATNSLPVPSGRSAAEKSSPPPVPKRPARPLTSPLPEPDAAPEPPAVPASSPPLQAATSARAEIHETDLRYRSIIDYPPDCKQDAKDFEGRDSDCLLPRC